MNIMAFKGYPAQKSKTLLILPPEEATIDLTGITTLADYEAYLFAHLEITQSNVLSSKFTQNADGVGLQYTEDLIKAGGSNNIVTWCTHPPFVYEFKLYKKPDTIHLKARFDNINGPASDGLNYCTWAIKFIGGTTGKSWVPVLFVDGAGSTGDDASYGGLWVNHCKTRIGSYGSGGTYRFDTTIDVTKQCPDCFDTEEKFYLVQYYNSRHYSSKSVDMKPFIVSKIEIK